MTTSLVSEISRLPAYRDLIVNFTLREVKAKYKQAVLGIAWAVIQPMILLAMMTLVFWYFARIPSDGIPYPLFLFAGLLPWQFFSGALNRGAASLVNQAALITKIYFPRETLVLASLAAACVDFFVTSIVFSFLLIYYNVSVSPLWLLVIPIFLIQLVFSLGLMLFLAPLNTMYRDVGQAIPLAVQVWMYASPLMYPASLVPARLKAYYFLNPMATIIESYRDVILRQKLPPFDNLAYAALLALLLCICGYSFFKRTEKRMADVA